MHFGPFPKRDVAHIQAVCEECGVRVQFVEDAEELARIRAEYQERQRTPTGHPVGLEEPAFVYADIEDSEVEKLGDRLSEIGIGLPDPHEPDFSVRDYYCPQCDHHSEEPGFCPKHSTPLMVDTEHKALQEEKEKKTRQKISWLAAITVIGFVGYLIYSALK